MNKSIALTFLLAGCFSTARALNLQPREVMVEKDGPPVRRYFFQDEGKRLFFRIDGKMSVNGSANEAVFRFSDIHDAIMKLAKSAMTPQIPFDEKNLKLYRATAQGYAPAQATEVQVTEENSDAVSINGWINHQFMLTYKLFGSPYRESVTFFNYSPTEQLVFDVRSPEADYEKTYSRSYQRAELTFGFRTERCTRSDLNRDVRGPSASSQRFRRTQFPPGFCRRILLALDAILSM